VASSQKRKGNRAELDVVRWLQTMGHPKAARIQAGTHDDCGDVSGIPGVVIEVKNRQQHDWAQYFRRLATQIINADAYTGVIVAKRAGETDPGKWLAVMPCYEWINLINILREARPDLQP
jgi:hypothetical protein